VTVVTGWAASSGTRVLLLGTGRHRPDADLPDVPAVGDTVADLRRVLMDRCGVPASTIKVCLNPASVEQMGDAVAAAATQATDVLLVVYVGHGVVTSDGRLHLATKATRTGGDAARYTALPYAEVGARVRESPALHRVVVLDCCQSGKALDFAAGLEDPDELADQTQVPGGFVLTSSSRYEVSLAPVGARHTAFTGALIRLLRDGDPAAGATLTLDAVRRHLVAVAAQLGLPEPRCRADGDLGQLDLAANPAYRAVAAAVVRRPVSAGPCPYLGLASFDVGDARWFFGRETLTQRLVAEVGKSDGRPVTVVGASGAGKSSLLRAGLIPALHGRHSGVPGAASWSLRMLAPGAQPLTTLATHLAALTGNPADGVTDRLRKDPTAVVEMLEEARRRRPERVLLIVDQFEEYFTLRAAEASEASEASEEHVPFAAALMAAARSAVVVIGIRADFYGQCANDHTLIELLRSPPVVVGSMTWYELQDAIRRPAEDAGLKLEDGLVNALLADLGAAPKATGAEAPGVEYEPGRLPLLSHALRATWQHQQDGRLTLAGYHATGRIAGALAATADAVMADIETRHGHEGPVIAERILTRLVRVFEGSDPARIRVGRDRLLAGLPVPAATEILDALASENARLISTSGDEHLDTVEIAHDSLLREWHQLRLLVQRDSAALVVEGDLRAAAERWQTRGHSASALHQGDDLAIARRWATEPDHRSRLDPETSDFLEASIRHDRRRKRLITTFAFALVGALLLAVAGTAAAVRYAQGAAESATRARRSAELAERQHDIALSRLLAAHSVATRETNRLTAEHLAAAALKIAPTDEAVAAADGVLGDYASILPHPLGVAAVDFGPAGKILATGDGDGTVRIWNTQSGALVRAYSAHTSANGLDVVAFSPDGKTLATGGDDNAVRIWDVATGAAVTAVNTSLDRVSSIAFSPDGQSLAAAGIEQDMAEVWHLHNQAEPTLSFRLKRPIVSGTIAVAFSPDGGRLATGGHGGTVQIRKASTGKVVRSLPVKTTEVTTVRYSPDGNDLATAGNDGKIRLWKTASGSLNRIISTGGDLSAVVFSPDGKTIAGAGPSSRVSVWNLNSGKLVRILTGHRDSVTDLAFSRDGRTLATAGGDRTVRLWNLASGTPTGTLRRHVFEDSPWSLAFNPATSQLVTVGQQETMTSADESGTSYFLEPRILLWDVDTSAVTAINPGGRRSFLAAAVTADGKRLFAVSDDTSVLTWDAVTGSRKQNLTGQAKAFPLTGAVSATGSVAALSDADGSVHIIGLGSGQPMRNLRSAGRTHQPLTFTPDGKWLLAAGNGGDFVQIWDVQSGQRKTTLKIPDDESVEGGALSPDGTLLATAGTDVAVRRVSDNSLVKRLAGNFGSTQAVAFNNDGTTVAAVGRQDGTVKLWSPTSGAVQHAIPAGIDDISDVLFSQDGSRLAVASSEAVRVWNIDLFTDPLPALCNQAGEMTNDEWAQFAAGESPRSTCSTK
jgi:WD40 repeat protein